jgi:hypothetical protein
VNGDFLIILILLSILVTLIAVAYAAKRLGSASKEHGENKAPVKKGETKAKTGPSARDRNVKVVEGSGFRPRECQSCGRYIIEPLEIYDSEYDVNVKVCPYCGKKI